MQSPVVLLDLSKSLVSHGSFCFLPQSPHKARLLSAHSTATTFSWCGHPDQKAQLPVSLCEGFAGLCVRNR